MALVTAVMGASLLAPTAAQAAPRTKPTIVVIGDSITASYNDVKGHEKRGWWSRLGAKTQLKPVLIRRTAENGSGFGKKGAKCRGTSFGERLKRADVRKAVAEATIVVIAGSINDARRCKTADDSATWRETDAHFAELRRDTLATLQEVKRIRTGQARRARVFVTVPYGPKDTYAPARNKVVNTIKAAAKQRGFRYLSTSTVLTDKNTRIASTGEPDNAHPNDQGSLALYKKIYYAGSFPKNPKPYRY